MFVINIYMKLNDIYQPDDEVLEEGLLRVIGKVLKWAAVVVGTVLLIGITKRIFFPEEEKEQLEDDTNILYKAILGARFQVTNVSRFKESIQYFGGDLKEQSEAYAAVIEFKKIKKDVYDVNFVLWYKDKSDISKLKRTIKKIGEQTGIELELLKIMRERV